MFKKNKAVKIICVLLAAGLSVSLLVGSMFKKGEEEVEEEAVQFVVDAINPVRGNIAVTGEYIGAVEPNQQVTVYAKLGGDVLTANYNVGDTVEAGAVLAQIDAKSLEFSIAQTQATLANTQAKAQLGVEQAEYNLDSYHSGLENGTNTAMLKAEADLDTAQKAVESARAGVLSARRTWREMRDENDGMYSDLQVMNARDAVTTAEQALEKAQAGLEQAEDALRAAQAGLNDTEYGMEAQKRQAELNADLSAQYIQLQSLQNDLSNATLTAPISGIIEQKNIDTYDMAASGMAAYVISNKDVMTISFQISETAYAYMQVGDPVTVEKNGQSCTGIITEISTMVNSSTGLFTVKATVENPIFNLVTGSSVKIYADTQKENNTLLVPISAVYYENSTPYVYVANQGIVEKVVVQTGIYNDEFIQILSGLDTSHQVITTWSSKLEVGAEVVVDGQSQAPAPSAADTVDTADSEKTEAELGQSEPEDRTDTSAIDDNGGDAILSEEEANE